MIFKARRDSVISSTSSDIGSHYSRSTGIEQDDDDDTTIENTQNSLERHLEASEIPPEKVQSSPGSEADTGENLSSKLTEIKKRHRTHANRLATTLPLGNDIWCIAEVTMAAKPRPNVNSSRDKIPLTMSCNESDATI